MANCDSSFNFWSNVSPRKPVQYDCNNTASARSVDRAPNAKTPFPLDKPLPNSCDSKQDTKVSNLKAPCCQYAKVGSPAGSTKNSQRKGSKGIRQNSNQKKAIPVKRKVKSCGAAKGLVNQKYGTTCADCKKYEADKAKPIEKLIRETRIIAAICAECECTGKDRESNYLKPKGKVTSERKLLAAPPDTCCNENCVGKRVYNKSPVRLRKKKTRTPAVRLMDWPWYWSRYFPTAATRVAKRIIQAKFDAERAKTNPRTLAEIELCFPPPERCTLTEIKEIE